MAKTREEHLKWSKERALFELKKGRGCQSAWSSMMSDLNKHPELEDHFALELGMMLVFSGNLNDEEEMKKFIKDFQ